MHVCVCAHVRVCVCMCGHTVTYVCFHTPYYRVKYVQLRKGPSGLGFTIVGGAGSSHGDKPIYVNRILEEGVAGRDRRLHKGDQLLAVNGINFEGVTHQFAAETLKQQSRHGDVELTVLSFE